MAKAYDILIPQFDVSPLGHRVIVDLCSIGTLQVNHIRLHLAYFVSKFIPLLNVPELNDRVLFGTTWMLERIVAYGNLSSKEPA